MQRVQGMPWKNKGNGSKFAPILKILIMLLLKKVVPLQSIDPIKKFLIIMNQPLLTIHKFKIPRKLLTSACTGWWCLAFVFWIRCACTLLNTLILLEIRRSVQQMAENPNAPNPNFSAENQLKVNISKCIDQLKSYRAAMC